MDAHEVRNLDREIEQAKHIIEMRDALVRLEKNRDFKKVITEGFLKDFVLNAIAVRARYEFRNNETLMQSNLHKIDAAAELHEFFRNLKANGIQCEHDLANAEALKLQVEMED